MKPIERPIDRMIHLLLAARNKIDVNQLVHWNGFKFVYLNAHIKEEMGLNT